MDKNRSDKELNSRIKELEIKLAKLKHTEQTLRESEEMFRTLAERSLAGIYVVQDGKFKIINHNAASSADYQVKELIGKSSEILIYPDDLGEVKENARAMLRDQRTVPYEFRVVTRRGEIRWVMETVTAISYEGRPAILGNSMSIGDRKLAEESLKESRQRLSNIIDFLPDATFAIDKAGEVIIWNRAMEEISGVKADDILGKGNFEYALPFYGDRRPLLIDLVLKPNKRFEDEEYAYLSRDEGRLIAETALLCLKGEDVILWGKAGRLYDSKGNIVGAIESLRDITARKQAKLALETRESDLKTKTDELEDLNAALRFLLKQRDEDRNVIEEKIVSNINLLILPHLERLKGHVDARGKSYINVLESNMKDIVAPFSQKLSVQFLNLTNKEVQVANLVKEGMSTKEIATFLNVSESAVNLHRHRIRHKLKLTKAHNLQSYLSSLS